MSFQSPAGNGCSLEDCHTNLFALTDLCGIKWRSLGTEEFCTDPLEDPVLKSYTRCLQSDILCVWRRGRKCASESQPKDHPKELWIFWYGEEPSNVDNLIASQLKVLDQGSWEHGLSYECRCLLFKALHNLIERCLLTQGFVRLGRWFVQPYNNSQSQGNRDISAHLSISFSFFLHGESTVCASIDVRQHLPVRHLSQQQLNASLGGSTPTQVILAPYGLAGILSGVTYKDSDQVALKTLEEWRQFFPIELPPDGAANNSFEPNTLGSVIEVIVAGVRMKYPTCFVLTVDADTDHPPGGAQPSDASAKSLDVNLQTDNAAAAGAGIINGDPFCQRLATKVWQENCTNQTHNNHRSQGKSNEDASVVGVWDFQPPNTKNHCGCQKKKLSNRANQGKSGKHFKGDKTDKLFEKQQSRMSRNMTAFHRRSPALDDMMTVEVDMLMQRVPSAQFNGGFKGGASSQQSGGGIPQLRNTNFDSADSPGVPSPLAAPTASNSITHGATDPTMPTLSPQQPQIKQEKPDPPQNTENAEPTTQEGFIQRTNGSIKTEPYTTGYTSSETIKTEKVSSWLENHRQATESKGIKRPMLPKSAYDESDVASVKETLYDFNVLNAWLDHPVKRLCHYPREVICVKQEKTQPSATNAPDPQAPMHDPYEFSEESSSHANILTTTSKRLSYRASRDDSLGRPPFSKEEEVGRDRKGSDSGGVTIKEEKTDSVFNGETSPGNFGSNFLSEKDLVPKYHDLDKMFDTSDDDSNDGNMHHISAPVGPSTLLDEKPVKSQTQSSLASSTGAGPIGATELAHMFPTPPSHEETALSPSMGVEPHSESTGFDAIVGRTEAPNHYGHLANTEEHRKELSTVFKPPMTAKFISAGRYAPIELPSNNQGQVARTMDCTYKPSWQYPVGPMTPIPNLPLVDSKPPIQPPSTYANIPSIENLGNLQRTPVAERGGLMEQTSPAAYQGGSVPQRTPGSYELQSPASNASSYIKNLNSVDPQGTNSTIPEAHGLVVNITLMDSMLNIYRDHNFDSCNMCVCYMNIKGSDSGLYLADKTNEPQLNCICGFSAVTNRKYGYRAGLFYEDEVDISGIRDDRLERRKPSLLTLKPDLEKENSIVEMPQEILNLLQGQFTTPFPSVTVLNVFNRLKTFSLVNSQQRMNILEIQDGCDVCYNGLEQGRQCVDDNSPTKLDDVIQKSKCLHKWPYLHNMAKLPTNAAEVVRLLKSLQPQLQEAIQDKRQTKLWENKYKIAGPLSWKDFHLMAGRGNEEASEPQPIPSLMVGFDKEWLSLAPQSLRYWDKLLLEPYGKQRNVAYAVVAPDNDIILQHVRGFFKELSTVYELCRLGKHRQFKHLRDGIMRVGTKEASSISNKDSNIDDWFDNIGDSPVAAKLRLYAQVCQQYLGALITEQVSDKSVFDDVKKEQTSGGPLKPHQRSNLPEYSPHPHTPDNRDRENHDEKEKDKDDTSHDKDQNQDSESNEPTPSIVVYIVDPFNFGTEFSDLNRLSTLGLLRCFQHMVKSMSGDAAKNNIQLQIVPLQSLLSQKNSEIRGQFIKSMAMSVFAQCKRQLHYAAPGKSLTGMGPSAKAEMMLQRKIRKPPIFQNDNYNIFSPPYILASQTDAQSIIVATMGEQQQEVPVTAVLYCGYCLSEDQRWLLAVCTDERGELLETVTINIEIPDRNRRRKASARKIGLQKLWDFILGVCAKTTTSWRLVIGRFGRLGHGELKGWAGFLSKKSLLKSSMQLREICDMCAVLATGNTPSIHSACLVSMELQASFRIMSDSVKPEDKRSSGLDINTPQDSSATHILVFPTSATAQSNSNTNAPPQNHLDPLSNNQFPDLVDDDIFDLKDDLDNMEMIGQDLNLNELFNMPPSPIAEDPTSPRPDGILPGSPTNGNAVNQQPSKSGVRESVDGEEAPNLLQQPLAMGYYVSTAKTGPLPKWFWSPFPQAEGATPTFFKSALHIHSPLVHQNQDELLNQAQKHSHPLDSSYTTDVLRYVLEGYNSLSWLTFDAVANDRSSCLPVHFVVLMQLYHAMEAYV
ncbi:unnamed protein product [Owenia fusiformis]|uniref:Mediator of RNA polymerase II transcription subunit 13 n=1 Tax=Owenia fusiformis TaxID=6347 RepID=A0A8S4Q2I0_OWEFU|nr:unnamed protein product [Owenia fusiformis]